VPLSLASSAFRPSGPIPDRHTCDGADVSPPLVWTGVPDGTRSLVLIVDDPDAPDPAAPKRTWVHWVLFDIPPAAAGLPDGVTRAALPAGTREGRNDWGRTGWGGPCPPVGRHRYFFRLYALDTTLGGLHEPTRGDVDTAMAGHVIETAELVGTFARAGAHATARH
jgi:Raf kinase inhibitor-like YbhB/YbcL family protein